MTRLTLRVDIEKWPPEAPSRITGHTFFALDVVVVRVSNPDRRTL